MPLLEINNVTIRKPGLNQSADGHSILVDSVNCTVEAGQVLSIIGPNGAGKSTLLKAIAGDLSYSGAIQVEGQASEAKMRARQLAVLPQLSLLNFPFRVSEVVALARIPHETGARRDQEIVQQALKIMDIDFLRDRLYTQLSGGEKQRVQLARVLAQIWDDADAPNNTRLLLLDEPTTALDLGHQRQLMSVIRDFADQGVAVLMVLHDVNMAVHCADTILALLCSQRIAFGSPEQVITPATMKTLFGIDVQIIPHPDHHTPVAIGI